MTKKELDFIGSMNMCDEISNEAYKKIVNHVEETEISDDCVSRQAVEKAIDNTIAEYIPTFIGRYEKIPLELALAIKDVPPVTPTHGTCKDCKHWKDSDGVYRRGVNAESKCSINNSRVFDGTFYCADFEKRGDLDGSN